MPYGIQIQNDIQTRKFQPSFSSFIKDFDSTLMCYGCQSFSRKFPNGLCKLCGFYFRESLTELIPNTTFHNGTLINSTLQIEKIDSLLKNIFGFKNFRENQRESIESYLLEKDTLTIMRTGGGKTLIYSAAALLSNRLTVVFSPLKSLMDDQLVSILF